MAKQLGVQIDLEQPVSDNYVDRAIRGEHYGQRGVGEALVHRGYTQGTDPNDIWNVRDDNSRRLRHRRNEVVLAQAAPKIEQRVKVAYQPTTTDGSGQRYRPEAGSHYAYIQGRMTRGLPQGLETGRPLKFDGRKFMYADSGEIFAGADYVHFTSDRRVIAYNSEKPIPVAGPEVSVGVTEGMAESVQQVVAEGKLTESVVFLNPNTVIVGQDHSKPLNLSPETLTRVQDIAAKHGAWYEGNGTDRGYTKGQIDKYAGSWDDEVAKTASPNDPKWLYVLFANVDENNRVQRIGVDAQDTIFNRLLTTAKDNSFQNIGFTSQALQKFLSMTSEGKYDFVKMSQQPATQENLSRFLKAGESLMWPGNWEQYPNRAGKIAKAATVDVRDQYLATRKSGVYVTGSGHIKAVQDITGQQVVAEGNESNIDWVKPNFDFEWHEVEEQSKMKQVPMDVRQYYQKYFPNKDAWLKAVQIGRAVVVNPYHNYEIRNAPFDKESLQKVLSPTGHEGPIGPEKEKRVNALFDRSSQIEMPIILKTSEGLWLIGGKTRLGTANYIKGIPAKVWLIGGQQVVAEASGYIPVTDAEARDPRYSMAITQDIRPGEVKRQAAKMGWKTNLAGTPPTARTNGLIEELTRKLQLVKEGVGFPLISEEELEEVAMSPSALRAFAASPAAAGMQAGFEAELVFAGALEGSDESGEMEPDYDMDERASDIDSIMNFFTSGDMSGIDSDPRSNSYRRARSSLEEDYFDWYNDQVGEAFEEDPETVIENWIVENDWDQDRQIEEFLREELELSADEIREVDAAMERRVDGKGTAADADLVYKYVEAEAGVREQLELRVSDAIQENNSDYESALDEFRENYIEEADESVWLIARGYRLMSDVGNTFDFEWPYWTSGFGDNEEGGYNPDVARRLASSLSDTLGVKTTVSSGYHSAKRDTTTWIFEPDGSLDADDSDAMPVEIVSPPMPLSKTLEILPKFFEWAAENGAYANDSTGFHMSVSMPDHAGDLLDYTKLAVFLGDEYVLQQFGREANTYAKSALQKIREKKGNVKAEEILSTMRKHLNQFASRALASPSGFGKYTSINPKNNYIEFRSAGGSNYFEDMDKIQNTLMRYARAMDIAFDPDADKPEYAKKLYKMLTDTKTQQTTDPKTGTRRTEVVSGVDTDAISIFSRYVAGQLPKSELKGFLKKLQYGREVAKNPSKEKIQWQVYHPNGSSQIAVMATSAEEAIKLAKQEYRDTMNPDDAYRAVPVLISPSEVPATQTPATDQMAAPAADDPRGNYVLRQREGNEGTGAVLHRFSATNNMAAVEAARQWTTARGLERRSVWLDHVSGVPLDVLNARPVQATLGEPRPAFTEPRTSSIPEVPLDIAQNFQEPPASWDSGSPIQTEPQNFPAARSTLGQWQIVNINTGEVVHEFRATNQQTANQHAEVWQDLTGFDDTVEVYPVMR